MSVCLCECGRHNRMHTLYAPTHIYTHIGANGRATHKARNRLSNHSTLTLLTYLQQLS